jgi:peptidyl-prolyl cis-trans isomerase C/peptidyl-prolyl cis-trans isomerase D
MKYLSFVLSLTLFSSFAHAQVVAKVGNREITQKEFDEKYNLIKEQMLEVPDKKTLLDDMISFEVGVQEAQKRNLDKDPIIRDRMMQELYKGFIEKELAPKTSKITVNEEEMKAYYAKYPEIRASHIMIEVRPDAKPEQRKEARKRAEEIYAAVTKSQRKFEDLVKIYSDDMVSNKNGGDIGWQTRLTHYPSLYRAATQLKIGEVSPLVETPYGIFIIKLTGRRTFAQADRAMLRLAVQEEKKKKLFDQFIAGIRGKYKIQVSKNAL